MKNELYQEPCVAKTINRFLAVLLIGAMLFGLCACAGRGMAPTEPTADETDTVVVEREAGPEALQTANEATALALRYYIFARLKTEELIAADFESMPDGAFEGQMDELVSIWETAEALTTGAEKITDQAVLLLEASPADQTAAVQPQARVTTLAAKGQNFSVIPLADDSGEVIDRQTWAENLSKQYDSFRGADRMRQLARQLGTDAKTAAEQMELAQKIIHNAADLEDAQAEKDEYNRCVNTLEVYKTGSKVGLYLGATVATGGGSLAALAGSSMTVAQAGVVIVGGVDCIADVGKTSSAIVLGENHQVTMAFEKVGDVLTPVSMVMSLATLQPSETVEKIALVGESVMEWFCPGKITGIVINPMKEGGTRVVAKLVDAAADNTPGAREALEKALEAIGLSLPSGNNVKLENLMKVYTANATTSLATMEALAAQIGVQNWEAPEPEMEPQEIEPQAPEETGPSDAPQPETATGAVTAQDMAGNYSGTAALQSVADDVEADDSLSVTMQLGEDGTGAVNVAGFGGKALYAGSAVTFSVTAKAGQYTSYIKFKGRASRSGNQIVISGDMNVSIMGVPVATYALTAQ